MLWDILKDLFENIFSGSPKTDHVPDHQLSALADEARSEDKIFSERAINQEALDRYYETESQPAAEQQHGEPGQIQNHQPNETHRHAPEHNWHFGHSWASHTQHDHSWNNTHSSQDHGHHHHHDDHGHGMHS